MVGLRPTCLAGSLCDGRPAADCLAGSLAVAQPRATRHEPRANPSLGSLADILVRARQPLSPLTQRRQPGPSSGGSVEGPTWVSSHSFNAAASVHVYSTRSTTALVCIHLASGHSRETTRPLRRSSSM